MTQNYFDIIVVTDPRFQGGTNSAVAAEVAASAKAGYRVGFLSYEASNLRQPFPFNQRLQKLIDQRSLTLIAPGTRVECELAILHNPYAAGLIPVEPLNINAQRRIVVVHHPPVDANGTPAYDLAMTQRNAEEILSGPVDWIPVGPNARDAFAGCANAPTLLSGDWANVIDFDDWRHVPRQDRDRPATIGRHSRSDPRKFPGSRDALMQIYGDGSRAYVDFLGCPPELSSILRPIHANWKLRAFGTLPVRDYIDGLDAFVYFHREDWVEAFGYAMLEAMARGVPCVLPATLEQSFGAAARIVAPQDALDTALEVIDAPEQTREAGYDLIQERYSFNAVTQRLNDLIGPPAKERPAPPGRARSQAAALLISTNGIGMGHLTRTIAIARRLQAPITPVIVTMSHGAAVVEDFGYHVEFIPYHNYLGVDKNVWNLALRDEVTALIDAHDARVVLFDGNSPFQGLIDALAARANVWSIWSRRGMWRPGAGMEFIAREGFFDAVLEPRDLAAAFDEGPTASHTDLTRRVDPIRLLDGQERLPRHLARAELGLDPKATTFLIQLGGGNNFDMQVTRDLVLRHLGARDDVQIALVNWKISAARPPEAMPSNAVLISTYPIARYLNAFDATVSAVGYNSFHEVVDAGLPAIYVPNENPSQDDQLARASFATRHGAALVARRDQPEHLIQALEAVLDPARRSDLERNARTLTSPNGAVEAARLVTQLTQIRRGHRG